MFKPVFGWLQNKQPSIPSVACLQDTYIRIGRNFFNHVNFGPGKGFDKNIFFHIMLKKSKAVIKVYFLIFETFRKKLSKKIKCVLSPTLVCLYFSTIRAPNLGVGNETGLH